MAIIRSGADQIDLTVDSTSKAARSGWYGTGGVESAVRTGGSYLIQVSISITVASTQVWWSMRNGVIKTMRIRRVLLTSSFNSLTAQATTGTFNLARFTGATPSGGSVILSRIRKTNTGRPSTIFDARVSGTGLTQTGINLEPDIVLFGAPRSRTTRRAVTTLDLDWRQAIDANDCLELEPNEGLVIMSRIVPTVSGDSIQGTVEWDEV